MIYFTAVICAIINVYIVYYEWDKKSVGMFIMATILVMFTLPHFITVFFSHSIYSNDVLIKSSTFSILFMSVYLAVLFFVDKKKTNKLTDVDLKEAIGTPRGQFKYFFLVLVIVVLTLAIVIIFVLDKDIPHSFTSFRRLAARFGFFNPVRYSDYLYYASSGLILTFLVKGKKMAVLSLTLLVSYYAIFRMSRMLILPVLVSFILYFAWYFKTSTLKKALIALGLGIVSIYVIYFLRLSRIYGVGMDFIHQLSITEMFSEVNRMIASGDGELGLRNIFYHFVENNNNFPNFGELHTYKRLFLFWLPTSFSGGMKPTDFAISMGQAWTGDYTNMIYSAHPTILGEVFANAGFFGILFGGFWAMFVELSNFIISKTKRGFKEIQMVLTCTILIIIARGSVYNPIITFIISSSIVAVISWFSVYRIKNRSTGLLYVRNANMDKHSSFHRGLDVFRSSGNNDVIVIDRDRLSEVSQSIERNRIEQDNLIVNRNTINLKDSHGIKSILALIRYNLALLKILFINRNKHGIIYVVDLDSGFSIFIFSFLFSKEYIYHIADYYADSKVTTSNRLIRLFVTNVEKTVMKSSFKTIICTDSRFDQIAPYQKNNVIVVHNTPVVPLDFSHHRKVVSDVGPIKLGYVGALNNKRFIEEITESVSKNNEVELHIAGYGPLADKVSDFANQFDNIEYYGAVNYLESFELYKKVDVILCIYDPSVKNHKYSAPNKFYEAVLLDKAIIVAAQSGVDYFVDKVKNGYIIEYNIESFEDLLEEISRNRAELSRLQETNESTKYEYSWENQRNKIVEIILEIEKTYDEI